MTTTPDPLDMLRGAADLAHRLPGLLHAARVGLRADGRRRDSLGAALERNARRIPTQRALAWHGGQLTWAELNAAANRYAHVFAGDGLRRSDVIAVLLPNRPELLIVVAALAKLGAIAALVPDQHRGDVLRHSLEAARASRVVTDRAHREALAAVSVDVPRIAASLPFVIDDVDPDAPLRDAIDLVGRAERAPRVNPRTTARVRLGDPVFYIFTSGTTGMPKASIMSHMRWRKAGAVYGRALLDLAPHETLYAPLPLFHNLALTVAWGASIDTGAALAIRERFSASAFWDDCRHFDARAVAYIGELPRYLLEQPSGPGDRDHRVTRMTGVGMRPELWEAFRHRFGIDRICETYSASEGNTMFFNILDVDGSIGVCPTPHRLVRFDPADGSPIRGPGGRVVPVDRGEPGLLLGRVSKRYRFDGYTDDDASRDKLVRDAFRDGDTWFNSGDVLQHIGFGHYVFVDRVGDTFRWKSENVSTQQVEAALGRVDGVLECVVYGVRVPGTEGRAGMAAIRTDAGFDPEAAARALDAALPSYAVPVFVRERDTFEVTGTFKHRKVALRDEGFDPGCIDDRLWVRPAGEPSWRRMDTGLYDQIVAGDVRL